MENKEIYKSLCGTLISNELPIRWEKFTPSDWHLFIQIAISGGVAPLIYKVFKSRGWPEKILENDQVSLRAEYYQIAAKNNLLLTELKDHLHFFENNHIPVILLKGADLALSLYEDQVLRPFNDLDILIKKTSLNQVVQHFKAQNYEEIELVNGFNRNFKYHAHLTNSSRQIAIEVHWTLVANESEKISPDINWFWDNLSYWPHKDEVGSYEYVYSLNPTANFLYLLAHLEFQHGTETGRLIWLYDLYLLIEKWEAEINWAELIQKAESFGWLDQIIMPIHELRAKFEVTIPIFDGLEFITQPSHAEAVDISTYARIFNSLSFQNKLFLIRGVVFPSRTFIFWQYHPNPSWLWPLWYIARWKDIFNDLSSEK